MRHPAASKNGAHRVRRPPGLRFLSIRRRLAMRRNECICRCRIRCAAQPLPLRAAQGEVGRGLPRRGSSRKAVCFCERAGLHRHLDPEQILPQQVAWVERSDTHKKQLQNFRVSASHFLCRTAPRAARTAKPARRASAAGASQEINQRKLSVQRQICHRRHGRNFSMRHPAASKNGAPPVRRPPGLRLLGVRRRFALRRNECMCQRRIRCAAQPLPLRAARGEVGRGADGAGLQQESDLLLRKGRVAQAS